MNLELLTELSLAAAFTMSCSSGWSWRRGLPSFFTTWLSCTWCSADLAKHQLRLVIWRPIFLKAFRFLNPAASSAVDKFCCSPEDWSNESSVVMAVRALPTVWQWQSTRKPCFFKASARPGWSAAAFTTKFLRNEAWESLEKQLCRAELRSKCTATVRGLKSYYFKPQLKVFLNHWTKNPYQTAGLLATQGSCEQVGSGAAKLQSGWFFSSCATSSWVSYLMLQQLGMVSLEVHTQLLRQPPDHVASLHQARLTTHGRRNNCCNRTAWQMLCLALCWLACEKKNHTIEHPFVSSQTPGAGAFRLRKSFNRVVLCHSSLTKTLWWYDALKAPDREMPPMPSSQQNCNM